MIPALSPELKIADIVKYYPATKKVFVQHGRDPDRDDIQVCYQVASHHVITSYSIHYTKLYESMTPLGLPVVPEV